MKNTEADKPHSHAVKLLFESDTNQ